MMRILIFFATDFPPNVGQEVSRVPQCARDLHPGHPLVPGPEHRFQ